MSPASPSAPTSPTAHGQPCRREDLAYQTFTIATILLVIITAWVF